MTVHRGRLTSLEVAVLWEMMSDDSLPFPLTHSPTHRYEDDYVRAKRETAERLLANPPLRGPQDWDSAELLDLWEAAVNPDIVIRASGEGPGDATENPVVTRVLGLRRAGYALVLVQQHGEPIERGGDVDVYETDIVGLAKAVIDQLPKVGPGKLREVPIVTQEQAGLDPDSSGVFDSMDPAPTYQRSERWRKAKSTHHGELVVEPGSAPHWLQDRSGYLVRWRDLADDGRYLIEPKPNPVAIPVDGNAFERFVNQRVAELVRRIRENRPVERDFRVS
ncbi:ESX secretion-associated protein EspG [Nocardia mexicana]|uniref:ESAT-6 protein secretion system EspG family protein n=1 Tax=Nocardia mexicana TaxID=279262 RepID=A0A370GW10_9NOCA|nr:ESX secretion-associated protein EspG [Nocardia mexicana]RDI46113.1 ESAT-6 protein secretion system EspG family protein [Nocardia mexicana]